MAKASFMYACQPARRVVLDRGKKVVFIRAGEPRTLPRRHRHCHRHGRKGDPRARIPGDRARPQPRTAHVLHQLGHRRPRRPGQDETRAVGAAGRLRETAWEIIPLKVEKASGTINPSTATVSAWTRSTRPSATRSNTGTAPGSPIRTAIATAARSRREAVSRSSGLNAYTLAGDQGNQVDADLAGLIPMRPAKFPPA